MKKISILLVMLMMLITGCSSSSNIKGHKSEEDASKQKTCDLCGEKREKNYIVTIDDKYYKVCKDCIDTFQLEKDRIVFRRYISAIQKVLEDKEVKEYCKGKEITIRYGTSINYSIYDSEWQEVDTYFRSDVIKMGYSTETSTFKIKLDELLGDRKNEFGLSQRWFNEYVRDEVMIVISDGVLTEYTGLGENKYTFEGVEDTFTRRRSSESKIKTESVDDTMEKPSDYQSYDPEAVVVENTEQPAVEQEINEPEEIVEVEPHVLMSFSKRFFDGDSENDFHDVSYLYDMTNNCVVDKVAATYSTKVLIDPKGRMMFVSDGDLCIYELLDSGIQKTVIDEDVGNFYANIDFSKVVYEKGTDEYKMLETSDLIAPADVSGIYYYDLSMANKMYIGSNYWFASYGSRCFLADKNIEHVYYLNSELGLMEWSLEKGALPISHGEYSFYSSYSGVDTWFLDNYDNFYFLSYSERDGYSLYRKQGTKETEKIASGITIENSFYKGNQEALYILKEYDVRGRSFPNAIKAEKFESLISQITEVNGEKIGRDVKGNYKKWDKENISKYDQEQFEVIKERYPEVNEGPIYVLREKLGRASLEKIERAFDAIEYDVENDPDNIGDIDYVEGYEVYYYDCLMNESVLLTKSNSKEVNILDATLPAMIIGTVNHDGEAVTAVAVGKRMAFLEEEIHVSLLSSYNDTSDPDVFYIFGSGIDNGDKMIRVQGLNGNGKLSAQKTDVKKDTDTIKIKSGENEYVNYDYYGYDMTFNMGADLYVNDIKIDDGYLGDYRFGYPNSYIKTDEKRRRFLYSKRIKDVEYELSYENGTHKNALMLYDDGKKSELCRDVKLFDLVDNQAVFIQRYEDSEYLGDLKIWDIESKEKRLIDGNVVSYYIFSSQ